MDLISIFIDFFNILIFLVFFFNLFNLYKIFYKKAKIKSFYNDEFKTIPDQFQSRTFLNKFSIVFWAVVGVISAYQWYVQANTDFSDALFSQEAFTLLAFSLAILRIVDNGAFSETKNRSHIFFNDTHFTLNPFDKVMGLKKHNWNELRNFELLDSQYKGYINIIINLKSGLQYKLIVSQEEKNLIVAELTKHLDFYNQDKRNENTDDK